MAEREKKASWRDGINQLWGAKLWSLLASMNKHLGSIAKNFEVLGRLESIDRRLSNIELMQGKHTTMLDVVVTSVTHIRSAQRDHRNQDAAEHKLIAEALDRIEADLGPDLSSASWSVGTPVPE